MSLLLESPLPGLSMYDTKRLEEQSEKVHQQSCNDEKLACEERSEHVHSS